MLDDSKFWQRVKGLEGTTVRTIIRNKPCKILKVDEDKVIVENRVSHVPFRGEWGLYRNYHLLHRDGRLCHGDNASGYSISLAIILKAVPDEAIQNGQENELKLKTK